MLAHIHTYTHTHTHTYTHIQTKYGSEEGSAVSESFTDVSTSRHGTGSLTSDRTGNPDRAGSVVSDRAGSVVSGHGMDPGTGIPAMSAKDEEKLIKRKKEQHREKVCLPGYPDLRLGQLTKEAKKVPGKKHVFEWNDK